MLCCREHKAEAKAAGGAKGAGVLYWVRQDFRLHDNPALSAAATAAKKQACTVQVKHFQNESHTCNVERGVLSAIADHSGMAYKDALNAESLTTEGYLQGGKITFVYIASLEEDGDDPETGIPCNASSQDRLHPQFSRICNSSSDQSGLCVAHNTCSVSRAYPLLTRIDIHIPFEQAVRQHTCCAALSASA